MRARLGPTEHPVLIVGQRLSAGQTLVELFDAGFDVVLSHRSPLEFGPGPLGWWALFRLHPLLEAWQLRRHGAAARGFIPKMLGGLARKLMERGTVKTFPAIARIEGRRVVFTDGRALEPAAVIFATGFRPALRHLAPLNLTLDEFTGRPALDGFESAEARNLFFLGLDGQVNFQSRFLRGIRNDAPCLAAELACRLDGAGAESRARANLRQNTCARPMTCWQHIRYVASVPRTWLQLTLHNSWGILNVLDIIWLRPMRGGLIDQSHPFCTGIDPETGRPIWHSNLVFRTEPRENWPDDHRPDADDEILNKVGGHLARQVALAASSASHPNGTPAPMPPGILYLHGGVHYNGGWLLFNDFAEAIEHFSDRQFAAEFRRFVREQRREPVTLFRDRDYDRGEFARFVCFMRTVFPWFSNSNGPKKFVLWGNPSPYPAVNTITGNWIQDCRLLKTEAGRRAVPRPPIPASRYFQNGPYKGSRRTTLWPEHLLAWVTERRIRWRGERENLYFVDKRKLKAGQRFGPEPIPGPWQRLRSRIGLGRRITVPPHPPRAT